MNHFERIKSISFIAFPIILSNLILLLCILINTSVIGSFNKIYFYYLAIFMPMNYFMMGAYESLRLTTLNLCQANSTNKYTLMPYIKALLILATIVFSVCLLIYIIWGTVDYYFINQYIKDNPILYWFIFSMVLAGIPIAYNCILSGALYAIGKQKEASLLMIASSILVCIANYIFIYVFNFDIFSLSIAEIVVYCVPILISFYLIKNNDNQMLGLKKNPVSVSLSIQFSKAIGIPTSFVYIIIFISLFCYNLILNNFGGELVSAFSVVLKIQNIIMIPAIAIGMSTGIIINRFSARDKSEESIFCLETAFYFTLFIYLILSVVIYIFGQYIVKLFITDDVIEQIAIECLKYFSVSYPGQSVMIMLMCVLGQTGRNIEVLLVNVVIFTAQIIIGGYLSIMKENYLYFYYSSIVINCLSLFYVLYKIFLSKKYRSRVTKLPFII